MTPVERDDDADNVSRRLHSRGTDGSEASILVVDRARESDERLTRLGSNEHGIALHDLRAKSSPDGVMVMTSTTQTFSPVTNKEDQKELPRLPLSRLSEKLSKVSKFSRS